MKTFLKIIVCTLVLALTSCGTQKSTQSKMEKSQQEISAKGTNSSEADMLLSRDDDGGSNDDGDSNDDGQPSADTNSTDVNGGDTDRETSTDTAPVSGQASADGTTNDSQMFMKLQMTEAQIQEFKRAMNDFKNRRQNTASGEIMMGSVSDERDRQMEKILSEEQLSEYQTWKNDN